MYSKADTHIHTTYSDGLMTPEEIVDFVAAETDLRVIAITDHDTAEGALLAWRYARQRYKDRLEVIIGQEVTTEEGDVVGLFIQATLPKFKTAAAAIQAIHAQGGLAIAVHPFAHWLLFGHMAGVSTKIAVLPFDGIETRNGFPANIPSNSLAAWFNRAHGQRLPTLGGSDSHAASTVGQTYTHFPGTTAADFFRAVEQNRVRAGGLCWGVRSGLRLLPTLATRGWPHHQQQKRASAKGMRPEFRVES